MFYEGKALNKDYQIMRFKTHYSVLFPVKVDENIKKNSEYIKEAVGEVKKEENLLIICEKDYMKLSYISALLSLGKFVAFKLLNSYELIEIFLDRKIDKYTSILDIDDELIGLTMGYSEPENKRQEDLLCQFLEERSTKKLPVWVFFRGNEAELRKKYKEFYEVMSEKGYRIIDLNGGIKKSKRGVDPYSV